MMHAATLGRVAAEQMRAIEEMDAEGQVEVAVTIVGLEGPNGFQEVRARSNCSPAIRLALLNQAQAYAIQEIINAEASQAEGGSDTEDEPE